MKKNTSKEMNKNMLEHIGQYLESITKKYRIRVDSNKLQFYHSNHITQQFNVITGYANNCPLICIFQPTSYIEIELDLFLNALVEPEYSGYLIVCYENNVTDTPTNRLPSKLGNDDEKYHVEVHNISALRYCLIHTNPQFPTDSSQLGKLRSYKEEAKLMNVIVPIDVTRLTLFKSQIPAFVQPRMRSFEDLSRLKIPNQSFQIGGSRHNLPKIKFPKTYYGARHYISEQNRLVLVIEDEWIDIIPLMYDNDEVHFTLNRYYFVCKNKVRIIQNSMELSSMYSIVQESNVRLTILFPVDFREIIRNNDFDIFESENGPKFSKPMKNFIQSNNFTQYNFTTYFYKWLLQEETEPNYFMFDLPNFPRLRNCCPQNTWENPFEMIIGFFKEREYLFDFTSQAKQTQKFQESESNNIPEEWAYYHSRLTEQPDIFKKDSPNFLEWFTSDHYDTEEIVKWMLGKINALYFKYINEPRFDHNHADMVIIGLALLKLLGKEITWVSILENALFIPFLIPLPKLWTELMRPSIRIGKYDSTIRYQGLKPAPGKDIPDSNVIIDAEFLRRWIVNSTKQNGEKTYLILGNYGVCNSAAPVGLKWNTDSKSLEVEFDESIDRKKIKGIIRFSNSPNPSFQDKLYYKWFYRWMFVDDNKEESKELILIHTTKSSVSAFPISPFGLENKIFFSIEKQSNVQANHVYEFTNTGIPAYDVYETDITKSTLQDINVNNKNIIEFFSALQIMKFHWPDNYNLDNCLICNRIDTYQMIPLRGKAAEELEYDIVFMNFFGEEFKKGIPMKVPLIYQESSTNTYSGSCSENINIEDAADSTKAAKVEAINRIATNKLLRLETSGIKAFKRDLYVEHQDHNDHHIPANLTGFNVLNFPNILELDISFRIIDAAQDLKTSKFYRLSDELFMFYAMYAFYIWSLSRKNVIENGKNKVKQNDVNRIVNCIYHGIPYIYFDEHLTSTRNGTVIDRGVLLKELEKSDLDEGVKQIINEWQDHYHRIYSNIFEDTLNIVSVKKTDEGTKTDEENTLFNKISCQLLINKIKKETFDVSGLFKELSSKAKQYKIKESVNTGNNLNNKPAKANTPTIVDGKNEDNNRDAVLNVCQDILEQIQAFKEVGWLKKLYNKLREKYKSKSLENTITELKKLSEEVDNSKELLDVIKKFEASTGTAAHPETQVINNVFDPKQDPFNFMDFFKKHELIEYQATIYVLYNKIKKIEIGAPNNLDNVKNNAELVNTDYKVNSIEELHRVMAELVSIFDKLMVTSMFGYYAYYTEVKDQIMSFLNWFAEAAAENVMEEKKKRLEEKKKRLEEKIKYLRNTIKLLKNFNCQDEQLSSQLSSLNNQIDLTEKALEVEEKKLDNSENLQEIEKNLSDLDTDCDDFIQKLNEIPTNANNGS